MVAIPEDTIRMVFSGSLGPQVDTWNIVLNGHCAGNIADFAPDTFAQHCYEAWADKIFGTDAIGFYFPAITTLQKVTLYALDTTDHATEVWEYQADDPTPGLGVSGALPPEVALCVSLETGRAGASFRGRSYLPGLSPSVVSGDGSMDPAHTAPVAAAYATFISQINAYTDTLVSPITVGVLSRTKNLLTPITSVKVGSTFDVQRRRRNGAPEVYSSEPVAATP